MHCSAPPQVAQLREELAARGLKAQGTKQILLAKLTEALEKEVAHALGGERRLAQWAASAVARLGEAEVAAQLEARGLTRYSGPAEAAQALQAVMIKEWVAEALHGGTAAGGHAGEASADGAAAGAAAAAGSDWEAGEAGADAGGAAAGYASGDAYGSGGEDGSGAAGERAFLSGRAGDPTLAVALLCGGHTRAQRDASLAAARLAAQFLQSDPWHGLVPQQQLQGAEGARCCWHASATTPNSLPCCCHPGGPPIAAWLPACLPCTTSPFPIAAAFLGVPCCAGAERQGIAVAAYYASGELLHPLTWEQLHAASAAELDARLELTPDAAATPAAELAGAADAVLPLGLAPATAALAAAAAGKLGGSSGAAEAAAFAADRLAFTGRATQLGFSAMPCMRLALSEFDDAPEAQQLTDLAAYRRLEGWAVEHIPAGAAPRLAVRAEASGRAVARGALACLCAAAAAVLLFHKWRAAVPHSLQPAAASAPVLAGLACKEPAPTTCRGPPPPPFPM